MYLYEDLSYQEIIENPSIDPDSPEAIYALGKCLLIGKGVEKDEEKARQLINEAIEMGLEVPGENQDLSAEEDEEIVKEENDKEDYSSDSLLIVKEAADKGSAFACLELSKRNISEFNDEKQAVVYLQKGEDVALTVTDSIIQGNLFFEIASIYEKLGMLESARKNYEYAKEKGNISAARELVNYYKEGIGGPVNNELAEACQDLTLKNADTETKYNMAVQFLKNKENMRAVLLFEEVLQDSSADVSVHAKAI